MLPSNLSRIVFGCEALGGTDWGTVDVNEINAAISRGLDLGINFFDTAEIYGLGLSEERLSHALGSRRHDVFIATKGGLEWSKSNSGDRAIVKANGSPEAIKHSVENSLRRLNLDKIPLYYIHWPDLSRELEPAFSVLEEFSVQGKIDYIGCSNFTNLQLLAALKVAPVKFLQIPLNMLAGPISNDIVDTCIANNVSIIAYNTLASGILTGKFSADTTFSSNDRRSRLPIFKGGQFKAALERVEQFRVDAIAQNISLAEYAIRWVLKQKQVDACIVGIKTVAQLEDAYSSLAEIEDKL